MKGENSKSRILELGPLSFGKLSLILEDFEESTTIISPFFQDIAKNSLLDDITLPSVLFSGNSL